LVRCHTQHGPTLCQQLARPLGVDDAHPAANLIGWHLCRLDDLDEHLREASVVVALGALQRFLVHLRKGELQVVVNQLRPIGDYAECQPSDQ